MRKGAADLSYAMLSSINMTERRASAGVRLWAASRGMAALLCAPQNFRALLGSRAMRNCTLVSHTMHSLSNTTTLPLLSRAAPDPGWLFTQIFLNRVGSLLPTRTEVIICMRDRGWSTGTWRRFEVSQLAAEMYLQLRQSEKDSVRWKISSVQWKVQGGGSSGSSSVEGSRREPQAKAYV